jgi:hypothetical protein
MPIMRNRFLALAALAILTASASAQGWAEKMFPEGLTHDFGTVARGTQLLHKFKITNIYAVRMEITSIKSGCGCVTASAAKLVLEPRESTTIEVRMDARRFSGPKSVGIRVTVGPEYINSAQLTVTANSRADVVFNPGQVSFGTVTRGQVLTQTIDVEYAGKLPWQVTEVVAKDVPYSVSITELYRQPGRLGGAGKVGYRLSATLKEDAPVGTLTHHVYLKTNDSASPLVPVLIEANVQSALTVTPKTLSLGNVKTATALTRRVVVRGNRAFRVTGIEGTGDGIELGAELPGKDAEVQFVTFKCQFDTPGAFKREVKIKTSLQDAPVVVSIEGTAAK